MHRSAWICINMHEYATGVCMDVMHRHRYTWTCMSKDVHGYVWMCMDVHGYASICIPIWPAMGGYVWIRMDIHANALV